jgi:hypothetical protein
MIFDVYEFGETCFWVFPVTLMVSMIIIGILGALHNHSESTMEIMIILSYVLFIGVVIHEAAHELFCKIYGVKVEKVQYFYLKKKRGLFRKFVDGFGYNKLKEKKNPTRSFLAAFSIAIAPVVVNGLSVALIIYFLPNLMESPYYGIFIYLIIALMYGALPSRPDLAVAGSIFQKNFSRGLIELFMLIFVIGICFGLLIVWQAALWISFSIIGVLIILLIRQGRAKSERPPPNFMV